MSFPWPAAAQTLWIIFRLFAFPAIVASVPVFEEAWSVGV